MVVLSGSADLFVGICGCLFFVVLCFSISGPSSSILAGAAFCSLLFAASLPPDTSGGLLR